MTAQELLDIVRERDEHLANLRQLVTEAQELNPIQVHRRPFKIVSDEWATAEDAEKNHITICAEMEAPRAMERLESQISSLRLLGWEVVYENDVMVPMPNRVPAGSITHIVSMEKPINPHEEIDWNI